MKDKKVVSLKEYFSYGAGGLGKGVLDSFVVLFVLIYFTDAVKISPISAGIIIAVSKIIVMLLLPFAGVKMDGGKSKWGRFRPYILWLSFVMGIMTSVLFIAPTIYGVEKEGAKVALCFIAYLLWETSFNLHDVPFWSLASVVSDKEGERSAFLAIANVVTTLAGVVPVIAVPFLTEQFGNVCGYLYSGLIFGLGGGILAATTFFGTKERITVNDKKVTLKESFSALFTTKPMFVFDGALLLSATVFAAREVSTYAGKYLYGSADGYVLYPGGGTSFLPSELFLTVLVVLVGAGLLIGDSIFPLVFKKAGLKKSYFIFSCLGIVTCVIMYLLGFDRWGKVSFFLFLTFYLIIGIFGGVFESMKSNLIPECADYSEWKTGVRRDGTFFSAQVMFSQLLETVPVLAVSIVLQCCGYNDSMAVFEQSESVKQGIFIAATLIPAGGMILGLVPAFFYSYTGKTRERIRAELSERRSVSND